MHKNETLICLVSDVHFVGVGRRRVKCNIISTPHWQKHNLKLRMYPVSVKYDCQILKNSNHKYCPLSRHCWIKLTGSNALEHRLTLSITASHSDTTFCSIWWDILDLITSSTVLTCAFITLILISPFVMLPKFVTFHGILTFSHLTTTQLAHSKGPHWFLLPITHVIQMFEQPANTSLFDD